MNRKEFSKKYGSDWKVNCLRRAKKFCDATETDISTHIPILAVTLDVPAKWIKDILQDMEEVV